MSISKPFAYNTGAQISGTTQYGDLSVGDGEFNYGNNYGGVTWWGGPDEELGYVIGGVVPGGQPVPVGVGGPAYVGFWRSELLTNESFLSLANFIGSENAQPPFTSTTDAVTWLNNNGYYTSYSASTQFSGYYIGGDFTTISGITQNFFTKLNYDGSVDPTFSIGSGFQGSSYTAIYVIEKQSDGKILVGGVFNMYNGSTQYDLIRLNSNGSKDSSFNNGFGSEASVNAIKIQSDGKILVGGTFSTFSGTSQIRLIRLNSDGSKDSTFNIGTGFINNGFIFSIQIDSNGKILVGGQYTTYQGVSQKYLVRLNSDGSKDSSFNIGNGFNDTVYAIAIQSDGKILVGGAFNTYQGVSQKYLVRLNSDGSKDSSFDIGSGFEYTITSIEVQSDGKILAGGQYTTYQGSPQNYLVRLNSDGSKDSSFNIGNGFNGSVDTINVNSDGKILVGGQFTTYQGSSQNYSVRLNSDGSKDNTFNIGVGFSSVVYSIDRA